MSHRISYTDGEVIRMGYFKELALRLQAYQDRLHAAGREDESYPSPVQQLLWRLEDWKELLRVRIEAQRQWEAAYYGAPRSDWQQEYRQWREYLPVRDPEAFHAFLLPRDTSIEDVMEAIAALHERLLLYGYDVDAEEERQAAIAADEPLQGQLMLPFAA